MSAREEQFEALADTLGDADFSYNVFDSSDEATTCIKRGTSVEVVAEHILVAGYRKTEIIGYIVVGKNNSSLDWDDQLYPSEDACIDSLCGPYQDFTRAPESERYWGNEYKLCPVLDPEAMS